MKKKHLSNIFGLYNKFPLSFFLIFITFLFAGCNKNDIIDKTYSEEYIKFNFSKSDFSRTNIDESGAGSFSEGDKITLFSVNTSTNISERNFTLTYTNGEWLPRLKNEDIYINGTIFTTISAYYPAIEDAGNNISRLNIEIDKDQSSKTGFSSSDILFASQNISSSTKSLDLSFNHNLCRLNIDVTSLITKDVRAEVYAGTQGEIQIDNGKLFMKTNTSGEWIKPYESHEGIFSAIIFPPVNEYEENNIDKTIKVKLTPPTGTEVIYNVSASVVKEKAKGGSYFTISFNSSGEGVVDEKYKNKKIWFYGVDKEKTPFYPESPWITLEYNGIGRLRYNKDYKIYDCNKRYYWDDTIGDHNQCWAAGASNLIHWWFTENGEYATRYYEWYNRKAKAEGKDTIPSIDFQPLMYDESTKKFSGGSRIFEYFTENFLDEGGFANQGLDWFFQGIEPQEPHVINKGKGGFLKEVFPEPISEIHLGMSKGRFNSLIKRAIEENLGVAYSIPGHVMNLWGAEFDEFGNVSYVYGVDNNNTVADTNDYGGASCSRLKIDYYMTPEGVSQTKVQEGSKMTDLVRLFFLPLKTEELKKYVEANCN